MEKVKINIGNKLYEVEVAYTDEEKEAGLSNRTELAEDAGMLFVWDEPEEVSIWMKDTKIPLDIIFIDNDLSVIAIYQGVPDTENAMTQENTSYVLEVNQGSGVEIGDDLNFSPNYSLKKDKMFVLNEEGKPQMELSGGERIFSRANTKILIKFAKKAYSTNKDTDFKALGKRVFKFLTEQDNREPEYVTGT